MDFVFWSLEMLNLPQRIENVEQLEELLSRPSAGLVEYVKSLDGDIMILGASGKIGPTMVMMAKRAVDEAKIKKDIIAVDVQPLDDLKKQGIKTIQCNMLDWKEVSNLPKAKNIVYMAGRKFGSSDTEWITWAINVMIPHNVADVFTKSRIAVFSTGCVYPIVDVYTGGSTEADAPNPIGEYAMSCLGRERMFDYYAAEKVKKLFKSGLIMPLN